MSSKSSHSPRAARRSSARTRADANLARRAASPAQLPQITNVRKCSRCGDDHDELTLRPLTNPPYDLTHFGTCPTSGEPILVTVTPT